MVKIFDNLWIKITALILGILLWFHVATEKIYTYQLYLPVTDFVVDDHLTLLTQPPESLMVNVSATGKQLMRKKWRERGLKIIASQFKAGTHTVSLNTSNTIVSSPTSDISLEEILSPASIDITIDKLAERVVKVESDLNTIPAEGFAISAIHSISPKTVTLIGPKSRIEKIPVIFTEMKNLENLNSNLKLTLPLALPSGYGIQLEPDSVTVSIEVVPIKTRIFENIPIVIYNIPTGTNLAVSSKSVRVEISGPPTEIDLLNRNALSASVDYTERTDADSVAVKIDCPAKFNVKLISPNTLKFVQK